MSAKYFQHTPIDPESMWFPPARRTRRKDHGTKKEDSCMGRTVLLTVWSRAREAQSGAISLISRPGSTYQDNYTPGVLVQMEPNGPNLSSHLSIYQTDWEL